MKHVKTFEGFFDKVKSLFAKDPVEIIERECIIPSGFKN